MDQIPEGYQGKRVWNVSQEQREANERVIQYCLHFKEITVCLGRCDAFKMTTSSLLLLSSIGRVCFPSNLALDLF